MPASPYDNVDRRLRHFSYKHLPPELQQISQACCDLAERMAQGLPNNPELTAGLRKLLEAKDCFVRAFIEGRTEGPSTPPAKYD